MPWLDDTQPDGSSSTQWQIALKNAFLRRIPAAQLEGPLQQLSARYPAGPDQIARLLLGFRARDSGADDPLLFRYADLLLRSKLIGTKELLVALLDTSRFTKRTGFDQPEKPSLGLPTCEERIFSMLTQMHMTRELSYEWSDFHGLVYAIARWMHVITEYEMGKQLESAALHSADVFSFSMYEAMASLALTVLGNPAFRDVTKQSWWKKRRGILVTEMESFDTNVLQWMQSQLAVRLRALTTIPPYLETHEDGQPIFSDGQILQSVQDLPLVNSRAALYVWLNACLYSRPFTDDSSMIMYLQARYSGNIQALIADLLTASFDVLTNVFRRKESEQSVKVVRSFICNKIPNLLAIFSGNMAPTATVEAYVQMAFSSIAMDALPPISTGATEVREKLKVTRTEFLQACALHGVVSENTVGAILQEPPVPLKVTKYTKEGLVTKYANNVGALEPLINELDGMHGNAAAISGCIVETLSNLCLNKDTISLKNLCNMLIKKISTVDILLQYTDTLHLLSPLCNQLNSWIHDQDQMEFTPAYEEFASILLFVFAVVHRYGLKNGDLGLQNDESFVSKLLRETSMSKLSSDLTPEQSGQLSKWIEGLFATDEQGETGGISDEVMRPCPPQAFYQLVPTLFEQSVLACKAGALSMKAFKGGLELLVEPFLLPSLVGGLSWVIKQSWEDHDDAEVLLQVLDKLLKPSSTSQETKAMHKTILGIIADPLYHSLQSLSQRKPGKKEVSPLMEILRPFLEQDRIPNSNKTELSEWISTPDGGIGRFLRNVIQEQVAWVTNVGPTPPPKHTHGLFIAGCDAIGVDAVLDAMVAELREQTGNGDGPFALDVCAAMICAPPANLPPPLMALPSAPAQPQFGTPSVREALRLRSTNLQKLLHTSAADAEALVRLARRVDAQLTVTQMPQIALPMPIQDQAADQIMADLGLTDGNLAPGQDTSMEQVAALSANPGGEFSNAELAAVLDQPMDMNNPSVPNLATMSSDASAMPGGQSQNIFDDLNLDIDQSLTQMQNPDGSNNNGAQNLEDDIFAELDMSNIDDFGFT